MTTAVPNPNQNPNEPADETHAAEPAQTTGGAGKGWLWWVGLLLAAILLFFGFRSCSGGDQEQPTSPTAEVTATAGETAATTAN
ncbi:hypothetical protein M5J20_05940 [Corynebacterium sp. TA-R-1]|uniref:Uncharacterized protein n=1 Tax=Corynebacterium stercoris TaxID=2943490 RepID=A0ABT1G123_9CORY|nr:hypothetical protein [Corynebacterium stercoris]MCP1387730.1 hypothetical protein [Corynebacterium stercoris]